MERVELDNQIENEFEVEVSFEDREEFISFINDAFGCELYLQIEEEMEDETYRFTIRGTDYKVYEFLLDNYFGGHKPDFSKFENLKVEA